MTSRGDQRGATAYRNWMPVVLIGLGLGLLALALSSALQPVPLPYERKLIAAEAGAADALATIGSERIDGLQRVQWKTDGVREPIASALISRGQDGRPVPLDWRNAVTEPVFSADLTLPEVDKVMAAIRQHVSEDAVVLSWWDLSRKIRLMAGRQAPLDDPDARGLIVPASWSTATDAVQASERAFWGKDVAKSDAGTFSRFIDALLMNEHEGADALATLVPNKEVYVAVHLSDIWKVASARPGRLEIGYRDFPSAGHSHGVVKATRQWINEQKIEGGYAVEPIGNAIRVHYFAKKAGSNHLITRLLPFSTSNPMQMERLQLVYQHRGFWIYKLKREGNS